MIGILVDSTSDLTEQQLRLADIIAVSSYLDFQEDTYRSHQITPQQVIDRVYQDGAIPTSRPPTTADFEEAYTAALETNDQVISFHMSKKLSKSYDHAVLAAQRVAPRRIVVFDCPTGSYGMGLQALRARRLIEEGKDMSAIVKTLENMQAQQFSRFTLDTTDFLKFSGRVSNLMAFLVTLFGVKPILGYSDGLIKSFGRGRGMEKAILKLAVDFVHYASAHGNVRATFLYTPGGHESAELLRNTLLDWGIQFEDHGFRLVCSPSTVMNGPRAIGVIAEPAID